MWGEYTAPTQVSSYDRKDWPHWIDADGDCQSIRQEMLIATSRIRVKFKDVRHCIVVFGEWFGVYTGKAFTKASDVDIDHIVSLARLNTFRLSRSIDFFLKNRYLLDILKAGAYDARENPITTNSIPISQL